MNNHKYLTELTALLNDINSKFGRITAVLRDICQDFALLDNLLRKMKGDVRGN